MKNFKCEYCGEKFLKKQLDQELFKDGEYYCKNCAEELLEAARNAVDPDHNFESYSDWDENGH